MQYFVLAPSFYRAIPLVCTHNFLSTDYLQLFQIDVITDHIYFIIQVWMIQCWQLELAFK